MVDPVSDSLSSEALLYMTILRNVMIALYKLRSCARLILCLTFFMCFCLAASWAQIRVLGEHNDNSRTGANLNETSLTTSNVNVSTFGKLFGMPVDGFVYAQPLYMTIGTQNVLFVATAHDSVYAFDADTGAQLWQKSLGTPVPSSNGEVVMVVTWSPTLSIAVTFGGRYHYAVGLKVGVRAPGHIFVKPQGVV